jgi:cobalt-zinc-cadmium efflux system protein
MPVLTAHVAVDDATCADGRFGRVLDLVREAVGGEFDIAHSTIQLEPAGHREHEPAQHA